MFWLIKELQVISTKRYGTPLYKSAFKDRTPSRLCPKRPVKELSVAGL